MNHRPIDRRIGRLLDGSNDRLIDGPPDGPLHGPLDGSLHGLITRRITAVVQRASHCMALPLLAALVGCATTAAAPEPIRFTQPIVLLGEVHDNAIQHALRLDAFKALLATGARPALVMEQLDQDSQAAIDAARAANPALGADGLLAAAGIQTDATGLGNEARNGWDWRFYRPFIALALQHQLPVIAANLPRGAARDVMRDGLAANGFDADVPPALLQAQASAIQASHCGMVDATTAARMALAQVARDQLMARTVTAQAATGRGAVLLAGNGHVRTDIGVPQWLDAGTRQRSQAIGMLEAGDATATFDSRVITPAQARQDPCAGMRKRAN